MTAFIMIKGHYDVGDHEAVESWYDYLKNVRAPFDVITYSLILSTKSIQKKYDELKPILNSMRELKVKPNLDCYYIVLATFAMNGEKEMVEEIKKDMLEDNISMRDMLKFVEANFGKEKSDEFDTLIKNPSSTSAASTNEESRRKKKLISVYDDNWEKIVEDPKGVKKKKRKSKKIYFHNT